MEEHIQAHPVGKQDVPSKEGDSSLLKIVRRHHEIPRDAHGKNEDPKYDDEDLWCSKARPTRHSAYRPEKRDGVVEDEEQHIQQRDEGREEDIYNRSRKVCACLADGVHQGRADLRINLFKVRGVLHKSMSKNGTFHSPSHILS